MIRAFVRGTYAAGKSDVNTRLTSLFRRRVPVVTSVNPESAFKSSNGSVCSQRMVATMQHARAGDPLHIRKHIRCHRALTAMR